MRLGDALLVRSWFVRDGGVKVWYGRTPAHYWITPLREENWPDPWVKLPPEVVTSLGRLVVAVPKRIVSTRLKVIEELSEGWRLTQDSAEHLDWWQQRLARRYTRLWYEFDIEAGKVRWYTAGMLLPLAAVKEGMV